MNRTYRRSAHVEAIAPWAALSVILLMWWAGAKTVTWIRPHVAAPILKTQGTLRVPTAHAIDGAIQDPAVTAPKSGLTLSADVSVTGVDIANLRTRGLMIPVKDVPASALVSSFNDARGGRKHEAIDILAPRGTPVIAADDGVVQKLFTSVAGGLTVYEFDPDQRYCYYYAHLDRYAAGLHEGQPLRRGEILGYVGTSGNASKDTPHLHFALIRLDPDRRWWKGTYVNPYPLLSSE